MTECLCTRLPNGIYQITLLQPSAVRQGFVYLQEIFEQTPVDQTVYLITDIRESGLPPISQLWNLTRALFERHPRHPSIYNAIVYKQGVLISTFALIVKQMTTVYGTERGATLFFDDYDAAVQWLLAQQ